MLILISVCMIAQPSLCHDDRIEMSFDNPNPMICLRNSQSALARWQGEHPTWTIKTWRCAVKGSVPTDL